VLKRTGHAGGGNLARAYARYGTRVSGPQVGAIAVMGRNGGGHVGVVSGVDANGNPRNASTFEGFFSVDVRGPPGHPGKLRFSDFGNPGFSIGDAFHAELGARAELNLDLAVSFDGNAAFPRLLAEFDLDWEWVLGGDQSGNVNFGLHNVRLDLGSFISQFIKPILDEIKKVTGPIQPLVDVLTAPIPILSDLAGEPINMLRLAELFGYLDPGTKKFIEVLAGVITLVNNLPSGDTIMIPLGGFMMGRDPFGNIGMGSQDANTAPALTVLPSSTESVAP